MFNPNQIVIDAFIADMLSRYREVFPHPETGREAVLEQAARTAFETLLQCDCPYHDLNHTIMVADVGQTILRGRFVAQGDVTPNEWVHALMAMLFHDVGYVRGLLRADRPGSYVADETGRRVTLPVGATDASLMPYHVTRGCLFVQERFGGNPLVDVSTVAGYIEMTRFPVPSDPHYQKTDSVAALVRAADLIGQMGDPGYDRKVNRLYTEFVETGEATRLGYHNAEELRAGFPDFFNEQVYPYLGPALKYLSRTGEGQQWIANLFHHVQKQKANGPAAADVTSALTSIGTGNR